MAYAEGYGADSKGYARYAKRPLTMEKRSTYTISKREVKEETIGWITYGCCIKPVTNRYTATMARLRSFYELLEPYEGQLSRTVLRREGAPGRLLRGTSIGSDLSDL